MAGGIVPARNGTAPAYVPVRGDPPRVERTGGTQVDPDLPPRPARVDDRRPRPPEPVVNDDGTVVPTAQLTPQARINDLARRAVDRLMASDARGVLDVVHGQRGRGQNDRNFDQRLLAAMRLDPRVRATPTLMAQMTLGLPEGERVVLRAYLTNPGGVLDNADRAYLGVKGWGSDVNVIREIYADLRRRNPDDKDFRIARQAFEASYVRRYGAERGVTSLDSELTQGMFSELGSGDIRRYRAARIDSRDAGEFYAAGEGRWVTHSGEQMLSALERNVTRMERFAHEHAYVADGTPGIDAPEGDSAPNMARLRTAIDSNLSRSEAARARALTAPGQTPDQRALGYLDVTLRHYLDGNVTPDAAVRAMRSMLNGDNAPLTPASMRDLDPALLGRLRQAPDRIVSATIQEIGLSQSTTGPSVLVAEVQRGIRGSSAERRSLATRLDGLSADERRDLRQAMPDFDAQLRQAGLFAGWRSRLNTAFAGQSTPATLLDAATHDMATANDVMRAVAGMEGPQRGRLAADYDAAHRRPGAFNAAIDRLSSNDARAVRMALAIPANGSPEALRDMTGQIRDAVASQRTGLSSWVVDRWGFSNPVMGDALREVVSAAQDAAAAGDNLTPVHVDRIKNAYFRLQGAMVAYNSEREDAANIAVNGATLIVGAVTLGAGVGVAALARAGAYVGTAAVVSRGVMLGSDYSTERAMWDFLTYGGGQAATMGVLRGGGALRGALTPR